MQPTQSPRQIIADAILDYATVERYHAAGLATDAQLVRARAAYLDLLDHLTVRQTSASI